MIPAPLPADEAQRLVALCSLYVLDTPPEERFDRITRLATQVFNTPIAAINLIDENRQWAKSFQGLPVCEYSRKDSLCAYAILHPQEMLVVPDAQADERFIGNAMTLGEAGVRFYAGHPLLAMDGLPLGTLCIADSKPRTLDARQMQSLRDLAKMAESELTTSELNSALHQLRTGEERLRRAEENYRSIFENVAEGIFQVDCKGDFINANPAVAKLYGFDAVATLKERVRDFGRAQQVNPARRAELLEQLRAQGRVKDFESEIYRVDGSVAWINESIHAVCDRTGACQYFEGTVHDITAQKYAAAAQAQARDEALKSSQVKSDFLSTMSHEIRTPMHGIIGMTGLLLNTGLNPEQGELVRLIASCGDNLLSLINNALDFSKIEAGCLELDNQPFALRPCLKEVIDLLNVQASNKNLTLACEVDPRIPEVLVSDVTRVRQILFNLISNSMKFTPAGGRVDVVVTGNHLSEKVENYGHIGAIEPWLFHFTVRDNGAGIPEDKLHRLFRPFSQADASISRKHGGTGLGLAICHKLCEMLGGAIWLESEVGMGSNFEFTIKAAVVPGAKDPQSANEPPPMPVVLSVLPDHGTLAANGATSDAPEAPNSLSALKILLTEDNPINQRVALGLLRQIGCTADSANNGLEAVAALEAKQYDVVLMDVQMPEMDGLEATREIRRRWPEGVRRPYIIAMTANAMTGDREKCLEAGMDEYISKPVKANRLKTALEQCCELRAAVVAAASVNGSRHALVEPAALNRDSLEALKSLQAEGDDGFLKEMVELFLADTPARLDDLQTALDNGQQQEFVRAVHSIKGASANFGADDLHMMCAAIEEMGRAGQMGDTRPKIVALHEEFERVRVALLAEV
jgi:PAS domain S-box-containing protein